MSDIKKLLARIGTARDAISRKEKQTSLDYMIDGVLMNCSVMLKEHEHKDKMFHALEEDWKTMLKEQDEEHRRLLSWLGKFCRHIDNGDAWLTDEENIAFFKKKMKQQFGWDTD